MHSNVLSQWMDFTPRWARVTFRQMMFYGVHLGHTVVNSTPYCGWLVAGVRQGLFLIDLFKFTYQLRAGLFAVEAAVRRRAPLWFVHPQPAAPALLSETARRCGEYFIHYPWLGGLLTNHRILRRSLEKWARRTDAGRQARQRRLWQANFRWDRWRFSRATWPRVLFVSSARLGLKPCHEAQCMGLPALTINDTNSSASLASIAIPANDESTSSLWFYTNLLSVFVLHRKFGLLNRFLLKSRRRHLRRQRLSAATAATLFASRDLWRRFSLTRLVYGNAALPSPLTASDQLHPWAKTLGHLMRWSGPWSLCHRRTNRWFQRARAAAVDPPYHRYSILKPRVQRALIGTFGRDRFFQRLTRVRGPYRSRPLWVFYQTFTTFLLAFATRWLTLQRPAFRRFWRRPIPRRSRNGWRWRWWWNTDPDLPQDLRRAFYFRGATRGRLQRIRLPWVDFKNWNLNTETSKYPRPDRFRRWQPPGSKRMRHPRAVLQISRYAARQFFASWFIHHR